MDNEEEKSSDSGEKQNDNSAVTKASLIKLGTIRYRARLEYPEDSKDKKYIFDNELVSNQNNNEISNPLTIIEMNSNDSNEKDDKVYDESKFSIYRDKVIVNENGKIIAKYINSENKECTDTITIDFIRFSQPAFTEVENTIKFSNIDNTDNKIIKYQIAKVDLDITDMDYETLNLQIDNIDEETLVYEDIEVPNNLLEYSSLETGVYFIKAKVVSDGNKNILDSKEIIKPFINKDGKLVQIANFNLQTVSINGKELSQEQLDTLMNTGMLELTVASNIKKVKVKASSLDTSAIILGADTYDAPAAIELKVQIGEEYKSYYIIVDKKGSDSVDKSNVNASTQIKNNNTSTNNNSSSSSNNNNNNNNNNSSSSNSNSNSNNASSTNNTDTTKPANPVPKICVEGMQQTNGYYNGMTVNQHGKSVTGLQVKVALPQGATGVEYTVTYDGGKTWINYTEMWKDDPNYDGYTITIKGNVNAICKFRSYKKVGNNVIYSNEVKTSEIKTCMNHTEGKNWLHDSTSHWKTCDRCGYKLNYAKCTAGSGWVRNSARTYHWKSCTVCGNKLNYAKCTSDGKWYRDDLKTSHWQKCKVCNDQLGAIQKCVKNPHTNTVYWYWECKTCKGLVVDEADIEALTRTICGEAGSEPYEGKLAVGYVVMNRMRNINFGAISGEKKIKSICSNPGQFDGYAAALKSNYDVMKKGDSYKAALQVIKEFGTSSYNDPTINTNVSPYGAMYFHGTYMHPAWANKYTKLKVIGLHAFYVDNSKTAAKFWQS